MGLEVSEVTGKGLGFRGKGSRIRARSLGFIFAGLGF